MSRLRFRSLGTTAQFAPIIKRGTGRLSTGAVVFLVPDTNRSDANGDDSTGVAKIFLHRTNTTRTAMSTTTSFTPPVASSSSTKAFVGSMAIGSDDDVYVAWQGTDNSLRLSHFNWNGTGYDAPTTQTIVTGNAVTNRYRAIDIDVTTGGTGGNPAVVVQESKASSGVGAWLRVYIRNNDGTTWRKAQEFNLSDVQTIRPDSSDVSIAWNSAGISSNVGQYTIYFSDIWTSSDGGDDLREFSYNVSTGTDGSATQLGVWSQTLHQNIASGQRRSWLFSIGSNQWLFASAVGTSMPFFSAMKLTHNSFTMPPINKIAAGSAAQATTLGLQIYRTANAMNAITAEYSDNKLVFGFVGVGINQSRAARSIMMRWANLAATSAEYKDTASRILDRNNLSLDNDPMLGIYGGANRLISTAREEFNFNTMYGPTGNTVTTLPDTNNQREFTWVFEDTLSAPSITSPRNVTMVADTPVVLTAMKNSQKYTSVMGKLELNVDDNSGFSSPVSLVQPNTDFLNYSSLSGAEQPARLIQYQVPSAAGLSSGTWYLRARMLDDMGGIGAWSTSSVFTISHPPVPLISSPVPDAILQYGTGDVIFAWEPTDPDPTDTQSAYQIIITRVDTGATVHDTGKVVSSNTTVTINISNTLIDIPLQWTLALWDSDDTQGPTSTPRLLTLANPPTAVLTEPLEAAVVATALPTFQWTFSAGGDRTQRAFRVVVYDTDASPDEIIADSGWVFSTATLYMFPAQILTNGVNYRAEIHVQDTGGMTGSDNNAFSTDWVEPAQATATLTQDKFKVTVAWTDAALDPDFVSWRVYRRYNPYATVDLDADNERLIWTLVYETDDNSPAVSYLDYFAPINKSVDYVVVQMVDRFGSLIESDISSFSTISTAGDRYFFVPEIPIGSIASFEASSIVGDNFVDETERETLHVIGRGRQVQLGDHLGRSGSFSIQLRNPATCQQDRQFIERLARDDSSNVYIRTPFGEVLYVSLGDPSFSRRPGSGISDMGDLNVTYVVVFPESVVTRT